MRPSVSTDPALPRDRESVALEWFERDRNTISIVVPVYNEEDTIFAFLAGVKPHIERMEAVLGPQARTEIVFVDDGSWDRTVQQVARARLPGVSIRLIKLSRNFGKDAALAAGLASATGDAVIPMDVDLQDPPEILPQMAQAWKDGAKIVNAVRTDRSSDGWVKRKTSAMFYHVFDRIATYPIHRDVGDFRLLDREVVNAINMMPERVRFMKGLFSWVGYSPVDIPVVRPPRVAGETKWRLWALWNFALDGITGTSTFPLRIWSYFGTILAVLALTYAAFIVVRTAIWGADTPGYASLMVVTLTLGAILLIALGVLGEYVGRIAIEVRQRPLFLIERSFDISDGTEDQNPDLGKPGHVKSELDSVVPQPG